LPGSRLRVISGGQTGVDRATLDAALALGLDHGGWCPAGRRAQDGPLAVRYPLTETETADYAERTRRNVAEADATPMLCHGGLNGGTLMTVEVACTRAKSCLVIDLRRPWQVQRWQEACAIRTLNVAGPRESSAPGIYALASDFLRRALTPTASRTAH